MDWNFRPQISFPDVKWCNNELIIGKPEISFDKWHNYRINRKLYTLLLCVNRIGVWLPVDIAYLLRKEIVKIYNEEQQVIRDRLDKIRLIKKYSV